MQERELRVCVQGRLHSLLLFFSVPIPPLSQQQMDPDVQEWGDQDQDEPMRWRQCLLKVSLSDPENMVFIHIQAKVVAYGNQDHMIYKSRFNSKTLTT